MDPPAYQEFSKEKIQVHQEKDVDVKILAGKWNGKTGPIFTRTPAYYFDVEVHQGGKFDLPIPSLWNSLIFCYEGEVKYQNKLKVDSLSCCVLEKE